MSGEEESNDQVDAQDTNDNSVSKSEFFRKRLLTRKVYNKKTFFNMKSWNSLQNESRTSSSNKETEIETNRTKRFDFLLKQTEIFSHFMPGSQSKVTPEKKKKPGRKKEKEVEAEADDEDKLDSSIGPEEWVES